MEFGMPIEDALAMIEDMLENMSDEQVAERAEAIVNNFSKILDSPEMMETYNQIVKEIDLNGYHPQRVISELEQARACLYSY